MKRIFSVLQSIVTNRFTGTVTAKFSKFKNEGDSGNTFVSLEPNGENKEDTDEIKGYATVTCNKLPDENGAGGEYTATLTDGNVSAEFKAVTTDKNTATFTITGEATFETEARQDTKGTLSNTNYEEWTNAANATEADEKEVRNINVTNAGSGATYDGRDFRDVKQGDNEFTFFATENVTGAEFTVTFANADDEQPQFTAAGVGVTEGAEV
jgi:hypothetical protein